MSIINPQRNNRIGIDVINNDGEKVSITSMVKAVEVSDDSPFWTIHFGRKIDNGKNPPLDDRGTIVLEESMIREIITYIVAGRGDIAL